MNNQNLLWYPECHELRIDLYDLLNDNRTLIIKSWNPKGISWALITDDGIEHYDDPFSAPYFPIWECLDQNSCEPFFDQIPTKILTTVKSYSSVGFGMLLLLSQNKFLTELYEEYSTLFWLTFVKVKSESLSKEQFVDTCIKGPFAMLRLCNLPANDDALETISKIQADKFGQQQYELICRLFGELDYHLLNVKLKKIIPDHLINFLLQHPECQQHLRLLSKLNEYDYPQLLQSISAIRSYAAELQLDDVSVMLQVTESCNMPALKTLENALRATSLERLLSDYENELADATEACSAFPQPPLTSTDTIVAITSATELLQESKLLKHDFVKYCNQIHDGQYYAYRVFEPERGTLLLFIFPTTNEGIKPVMKELVTFNGKMADYATFETVESWLHNQSRHADNN